MPEVENPEAVIGTARVFKYSPAQIYAAFQDPELLARWWGPNGFTNTFQEFEFVPDGHWVFVMHGPNGADYPNESYFRELVPNQKIVIDHVCQPLFRLTITLTEEVGGTHLDWHSVFESVQVAAAVRKMFGTANEENLDRLESVLAGQTP